MANIKSSKKDITKSKTQRKYNVSNRSRLRTFIKKINIAIKNNDTNIATSMFVTIQKTIDQQTSKGLIHKNQGARLKSNIFKYIKHINPTSESS